MTEELKVSERGQFDLANKELSDSLQVLNGADNMIEDVEKLLDEKEKSIERSEKIVKDLRNELLETKQKVNDSKVKFEDNLKKIKEDPVIFAQGEEIIPDIDADDFMIKAYQYQNRFKIADHEIQALGEALNIGQRVAAYENAIKNLQVKYQVELKKLNAVKADEDNKEIEKRKKEISDLNELIANLKKTVEEEKIKLAKIQQERAEEERKERIYNIPPAVERDDYCQEFINRLKVELKLGKKVEDYAKDVKQLKSDKENIFKDLESGKKELDKLIIQAAEQEKLLNGYLERKFAVEDKISQEQARKILALINERFEKPKEQDQRVESNDEIERYPSVIQFRGKKSIILSLKSFNRSTRKDKRPI